MKPNTDISSNLHCSWFKTQGKISEQDLKLEAYLGKWRSWCSIIETETNTDTIVSHFLRFGSLDVQILVMLRTVR